MKIDVTLSVSDIKQDDIHNKTVIVIDSLRATSTILTALNQGCQRVIPVETVGQALHYDGLEDTVLIGERYGKKMSGFDLGNSPLEVSKINLSGKTVVITTTNGTKALQKARKASHILVGSFLNATHCIESALRLKKDIMLLCAGRRGKFAIEDGLTAGLMIHQLKQSKGSLECSDIALILENNFCCKEELLSRIITEGATGRTLVENLNQEDIGYCLQLDLFPLTGIYLEQGIVQLLEDTLPNKMIKDRLN
jgi:2-phosphosulfolactate phosphatase